MKRTSPRRAASRHRSRSLLVAVSLSMVPIVYPVLHAHIFSYLFIIYVITHAWTSPEKYLRDHERSFLLDIMLAHLQLLISLSASLSHTHVNRGAHTHTYVHTREEAKLTRPFVRPSVEEIGSTIIARSSFVDSFFPSRQKMGKNRAKLFVLVLFSFLFFFSCRIDTVLAALTRIYKKITHAGVARSWDVKWCVGVCLKRLDSARVSLAYHLCRKLSILRIKCLVYLS